MNTETKQVDEAIVAFTIKLIDTINNFNKEVDAIHKKYELEQPEQDESTGIKEVPKQVLNSSMQGELEELRKEYFRKFGDVRRNSIIKDSVDSYDIWDWFKTKLEAQKRMDREEVSKDFNRFLKLVVFKPNQHKDTKEVDEIIAKYSKQDI